MTQLEIYSMLKMNVGDHFLYLNHECQIDNRPVLLLYDYEYGDWIASRYEVMQVEYLIKNIDKVRTLPREEWHLRYAEL